MVAYALDALAFCKSMLGHPYVAGGCRCEVSCYTQDCSGLCVAATRAAGLAMPCISSAGFAVWGREAGTLISEQEAIHTPFALGIKGPNGGEAGNGPLGHIFPMVGDGLHTYEAMGTRYGICIGSATGRNAVRWMKVPGLVYGPKPLPFQPESTMIVQSFHVAPDGHTRVPIKAKSGDRYLLPTIAPTADGKALLTKDGASFTGAGKALKDGGEDRWAPPDLGNRRIIAVADWDPHDGTIPGFCYRLSDGAQSQKRFT